ncbi:aminotransferase-like domain-containing protein [Bradyrhizobium sp. CCBAU 21362]|uniref:aminotransferase-like domain-containing protein n=1 Tax=Bradyrhizobium sp. CCBAU 21362 TaxID=1325082 RepID=UPI00230541CA|nr:PLP-dependent aminotransferase family protein [Bradyrhizobium sp. CCBAU 21362]
MNELSNVANCDASTPVISAVSIDLARNFPPPCPLIGKRLGLIFSELDGAATAGAIRFPRFTGTTRDRAAAAGWVARRLGVAPDPERIVLSNGTQSTLLMLLASFVQPGNILLTEELTYAAMKPISSLFGIKLFPIKMDHEGLIPDALANACITLRSKARALYCMPTLHNPTAATMSVPRRAAVAEAARRHNLWIFEDDIYGVLPEAAPPPLQTFAPERTWYILGLSKSLAAQLRVAYVVAPSETMARDVFWPGVKTTNWMAAPMTAEIATLLVEQGAAEAILESVRAETNARQEILRNSLPSWTIRVPPFCYHVWLDLPPGWSAREFEQAVRRKGISITAGDSFSPISGEFAASFRVGLGAPSDHQTLRAGLNTLNDTRNEIAPADKAKRV